MSRTASRPDLRAVDGAIESRAPSAFGFLKRLVAAPSTVGNEGGAQEVVAAELGKLGFEIERLPIPEAIADDPLAGVPLASYEGRYDVVGRVGPVEGPSLLIDGHVDVVPAGEPDLWFTPPFVPRRRRGRLYGRGAGDMKGGFAMATLAIEALMAEAPESIDGPLTFLSAIEEECTGNGTLAAARAGVTADAVILPEPTDLQLLLAGVGILWLDLTVHGRAAHAESADRSVNPVDATLGLLPAIRAFERAMNEDIEPSMAGVTHPYNVNLGQISAGDWGSSVPARARVRVRIGHPTAWSAEEAERRFSDAIATAAAADPWMRRHRPDIDRVGFRAQGYSIDPDHPLVRRLADAHEDAHGDRPASVAMGSTTDARIFLRGFDVPAVCYGPVAHEIHGINESVELDSIVDGAKTLVRFVADWYANPEPRP
ncbi:MAG: ArgE/DapE family deacylase [Actinomycetota bacterium]